LNPSAPLPQFPVFFRLQKRLCVVVGSGHVGRRKALALGDAGARVRIIGPEAGRPATGDCEIIERPYRAGDLAGAFLAFAATDDRRVNAAVAAEAKAAGIPVNVADAPEDSDFFLPAQLHRGDLSLAVSTGGRSPAFAAAVRDRLAGVIGPEWELALAIAAALRQKKLTLQPETEYNSAVLLRLLEGNLPALLASGETADVDRLLANLAGEGCSLANLGICLSKGET